MLRLSLVLLVATAATAADDAPPPARVNLPVSNEATLLLRQLEQAKRDGEYRLAIRLAEQIMDMPGALVAVEGQQTYHPAARAAVMRLRQLPPEGVRLYRQLYDAEVRTLLAAATARGDTAALERLFRRHVLSAHWIDVGSELCALLLENGDYASAVEVGEELRAAGVEVPWPVRIAQVVALAQLGARDAAQAELQQLSVELPADAAEPRALLARVSEWLGQRAGGPAGRGERPLLTPEVSWQQPLNAPFAAYVETDDEVAALSAERRLPPLQRAAVSDGVALTRARGVIWAFDADALEPLWSQRESALRAPARPDYRANWGMPTPDESDRKELQGLAGETRLLLNSPLRHALSAADGRVYTVEAVSTAIGLNEGWPNGRFRFDVELPAQPNDLVARELLTGRVLWHTGSDPMLPLYNAAFQDAPLVVGGRLIALVHQGDELRLVVLDPATGAPRGTLTILGAPVAPVDQGGAAALCGEATTLYACSGRGMLAALRVGAPPAGAGPTTQPAAATDLSWLWVTTYTSTRITTPTRNWDPDPRRPAPAGTPSRLVLTPALVVAAPSDSEQWLALDRFTGAPRWSVARGNKDLLVGAVSRGLVVASTRLTCLDPNDGQTERWQSVPLDMTGIPTVCGDDVLVPTTKGLALVEGRTGRVVADQWPGTGKALPPTAVAAANLLVAPDAVFAVTPHAMAKYPLPEALRERLGTAATPRAGLLLAQLDAMVGRLPAARDRLAALPDDPALRTLRGRLSGEVLLRLAENESDPNVARPLLERAWAAANDADDAARAGVALGRCLEALGDWPAAERQYTQMLSAAQSGLAADPDDPGCRTTGWLYAAERWPAAIAHLPSAAQAAAHAALLARIQAGGDVHPLLHVCEMLKDSPAGDAARTRLALWEFAEPTPRPPVAPEVLADYLPPASAARGAALVDQRLRLKRWDTHVAIGDLAAATVDADAWESLPRDPNALPPPPAEAAREPGPETPEEWAARIDAAQLKLDVPAELQFTPTLRRAWKIEQTELVCDPRVAVRDRRLLLTRKLQERRLVLMFTGSNQPRAGAADVVVGELDGDTQRELAERAVLGGGSDYPAPVGPWPALSWGRFTAVPTAGGIVCFGLSLELGRDRHAAEPSPIERPPLWTYALPELRDVPAAVGARAVAGPAGIYLLLTPGRLLHIGWSDGELRWERTFNSYRFQEIMLAGDALVLVDNLERAFRLDARTGRNLRPLPAADGAAAGATLAIGDVIVRWTGTRVVGLRSDGTTVLWEQACPATRRVLPVAGRDWLAWQTGDAGDWVVVGAATGAPALPAPLAMLTDVTTLAADGRSLYVGCNTTGRAGGPGPVRLCAYNLADGQRVWDRTVPDTVPMNLTQFVGHPQFIPLLTFTPAPNAGGNQPRTMSGLRLMLIDKTDGNKPVKLPDAVNNTNDTSRALGSYFSKGDGNRGVSLLVTPSTMIVQAAGHIAAFGTGGEGG